ncbi:MAG TPA: DUF4381 family protein [Planctomycetota bacterium]|nr:DUF4381 family protein [Planctomycetota bacterium]
MKRAWIAFGLGTWLALGQASAAGQTPPRAQLVFEPATASVGEPVRARLSVEHARTEHPTLDALGLDDSWVVFASGAGLASNTADPLRVTTTWEFQVASLEPGERALPAIPLKLGDATLAVDVAKITVTGVLAEGEDDPRALRGLRDIQAAGARTSAWTWMAAGAALVCALATLWLVWRARKKPASTGVPAPSVRLALLEAQPLDTPDDVQAAHFALTRLLRESADLRTGSDLSGLTDEEWRAASSAQLDAAGFGTAERELLERLFAEATRVKYGKERPTHWATREALAHARGLARRFESPLPEAPVAEQRPEVAA